MSEPVTAIEIPAMEPTPEKPSSSRIWLWIAAAFVGFWAVVLILFAPRRFENLVQTDSDVDYSMALEDLEGRPLTLEAFRGKPIFLNFWATWCGPCVREMPSIAALAANPQLKDVAFVCASVDDGLPEVREFLKQTKLPLTVYHVKGYIPEVFDVNAIPSTYIIDRNGKIVDHTPGSQNWNKPSVISRLEALARAPVPASAGARQ
jgi:thiol-disulfide isomerase/thioredoxin